MLCYRCGRLDHKESHCTEPNLELNNTGMPGANLRGNPGLQEPVQNHIPWKTVQTRRPRPRGHQLETLQRGKPLLRDDPTPTSQSNRTASQNFQVLQNQSTRSVKTFDFNTLEGPVGLTCGEVAMHGEKKNLLRPRTPIPSMHALPSSSCPCPSAPAKAISMQQDTHLSHMATPKITLTPTSPTYGSLLKLKFVHSHSNRPRPPSHAHSPKQSKPSTHFDHELPHTQPPRTSSGNGSSLTDLEWSLTGTLRRRDGELC